MAISAGTGAVLGSAISGGLSLLGGGAQADAAGAATAALADYYNRALNFQKDVYEEGRRDTLPYRKTGAGALNRLSEMFLGAPSTRYNELTGQLMSGGDEDIQAQIDALDKEIAGTPATITEQVSAPQRPYPGGGPPGAQEVPEVYMRNQRPQTRTIDNSARLAELRGQRNQLASQLGQGAPETLYPDYSEFYKSPSYNFRMDEGLRALDRSAAARGQLRGGGYGRDLTQFAQGLASTEFNNYANRLATMAGIGQTATGQAAGIGQGAASGVNALSANFGNAMAGALQNQGAARASGFAGLGNAVSGGVQNYMLYNLLQG